MSVPVTRLQHLAALDTLRSQLDNLKETVTRLLALPTFFPEECSGNRGSTRLPLKFCAMRIILSP